MKKNLLFGLLIVVCLLLVGCGDNSSNSSSSKSEEKETKKNIVYNCSGGDDDEWNLKYESKLVLKKKTNEILSGDIEITLTASEEYTEDQHKVFSESLKNNFCSEENGIFPAKECNVSRDGTNYSINVTFDPDGLAEEIFNKENTELEDVDLERIETYYSSLAGNTTCKQSKE